MKVVALALLAVVGGCASMGIETESHRQRREALADQRQELDRLCSSADVENQAKCAQTKQAQAEQAHAVADNKRARRGTFCTGTVVGTTTLMNCR